MITVQERINRDSLQGNKSWYACSTRGCMMTGTHKVASAKYCVTHRKA